MFDDFKELLSIFNAQKVKYLNQNQGQRQREGAPALHTHTNTNGVYLADAFCNWAIFACGADAW